jgi:hypothetical protein
MTAPKTMDLGDGARRARTERLLAHWRGNKNEWRILHGILCMDHAFSPEDAEGVGRVFDSVRIAERLDAINAESAANYSRVARTIGDTRP